MEEDDDDDLWGNPIFVAMQESIPDFNNRACSEHWLILIPPRMALTLPFSSEFVERHIVMPSPYLKDEYIDMQGNSVTIENGCIEVCGKNSRILSEETFYGAQGSFRAIMVSVPLDNTLNDSISQNKAKYDYSLFNKHKTVKDWMFVLNTDRSIGVPLRELESEVLQLRDTFVLIPNEVGTRAFLDKIDTLVSKYVPKIVERNPIKFGLVFENAEMKNMLRRALEAYAFIGVHDAVFNVLVKLFSEQEKALSQAAIQHRNAAHSTNEVQKLESQSALFFRGLNKERCPLAKLEYLKGFLETKITSLMNADNILDSLVQLIAYIPSDYRVNILANLRYLRTFFSTPLPSDMGYLAFQFHATVTFVLGSDVDLMHVEARKAHARTRGMRTPPQEKYFDPSKLKDAPDTAGAIETTSHSRQKPAPAQEDLGGFLMALKNSDADVVSSSSKNRKLLS